MKTSPVDVKWYERWRDRYYLCHEDPKSLNPYDDDLRFHCYKYNSFKGADDGWWKDQTEYHYPNMRHTVIPITKWVPEIFDRYLLNYKLKNKYWTGNIWTGNIWIQINKKK